MIPRLRRRSSSPGSVTEDKHTITIKAAHNGTGAAGAIAAFRNSGLVLENLTKRFRAVSQRELLAIKRSHRGERLEHRFFTPRGGDGNLLPQSGKGQPDLGSPRLARRDLDGNTLVREPMHVRKHIIAASRNSAELKVTIVGCLK